MLTRTNSEIKCEKTDREGITMLEFTGTVCVGMLKKLQVVHFILARSDCFLALSQRFDFFWYTIAKRDSVPDTCRAYLGMKVPPPGKFLPVAAGPMYLSATLRVSANLFR
jgi:hypothetical protein